MSGFADWLWLLLVVAIVYVLVRPKSKAAELVNGFFALLIALVKTATAGVNE